MNQYRCKHCGAWFDAGKDPLNGLKFCSQEHCDQYLKELNEWAKKESESR
jgi:hypothetical protein